MSQLSPALSRPGPRLRTERRSDQAYLAAAWADERTRVLALAGELAPVIQPADGEPRLSFVRPASAGGGDRLFLGEDDEGVAYFAVMTPAAASDPAAATPAAPDSAPLSLRQVGALLSARDAALLTQAVALAAWHRLHPHCARCGAATEVVAGGHQRRCPACGAGHFPRTDPAVIMLVTDPDDRVLLARGAHWPPKRHSVLAGFVEPGESIEQAVAREVAEETSVPVVEPKYMGSQPWPFPSSLMLAFTAKAAHAVEPRVDGVEVAEARWLSRAELRALMDADAIRLPGPVSIAHHLIEHWYGAPLPGRW